MIRKKIRLRIKRFANPMNPIPIKRFGAGKLKSDYRLSDLNLSFEERSIAFFKVIRIFNHFKAFLNQLSLILAIHNAHSILHTIFIYITK